MVCINLVFTEVTVDQAEITDLAWAVTFFDDSILITGIGMSGYWIDARNTNWI